MCSIYSVCIIWCVKYQRHYTTTWMLIHILCLSYIHINIVSSFICFYTIYSMLIIYNTYVHTLHAHYSGSVTPCLFRAGTWLRAGRQTKVCIYKYALWLCLYAISTILSHYLFMHSLTLCAYILHIQYTSCRYALLVKHVHTRKLILHLLLHLHYTSSSAQAYHSVVSCDYGSVHAYVQIERVILR